MTCIDAFKNLNIVNINNRLSISPCCVSPTVPVDQIDFNNQYLLDIRDTWRKGQFPLACMSCKYKKSSRMAGSNQWYVDHNFNNNDVELIRLDYWVGDICNLRCVICGPHNSSSWKYELGITEQKQIVNKYWQTLDLTKLKFVHFNGGEPLLSKEHVEFLKDIPNKTQVQINYNTNGTVRPSQALMDLWSEFDLVLLDFSIDDIGTRYEYQRYPASWSEVKENLQWFRESMPVNCMFAINTTVSILNQDTIQELDSWIEENFSENRLGDKIEHRKQMANGILSTDKLTGNFVKYLDQCDNRRGTDWRQVFPNLSQKFINIR